MVTQNDMDIQLLTQKVDWLCSELKEHMDYEEKQRDKIEEKLTHIDRKMNKVVTYGTVLITLVSGGSELLTSLPIM